MSHSGKTQKTLNRYLSRWDRRLERELARFRRKTPGEKVFDLLVWVFLCFGVVICAYPFLYVLSVSLSSGEAVNKGQVWLLPVGLSLDSLVTVLTFRQLWVSFGNTVLYTVAGTALNLLMTCLAAYPLSRHRFFLRRQVNFLITLTMYFSGGLIPIYIVVTKLGLYNSRWAMILPVLVSAFNVMICRSAFEGLPEDLFEEAAIEGANDLYIFGRIAVPLIKPTLAVLTLYYGVARYNDFYSAMLYISDPKKEPLQLFLRRVLLQASMEITQTTGLDMAAMSQYTIQIRYVCIVLSVVPILVIIPFVHRHLIQGAMIGAVKG